MNVTHKLYPVTLHHAKICLTTLFESKILDFEYYNRALGNAVTSNQIIYTYFSMNEVQREIMEFTSKIMISFINKIIFLLEEVLIFPNNFLRIY